MKLLLLSLTIIRVFFLTVYELRKSQFYLSSFQDQDSG